MSILSVRLKFAKPSLTDPAHIENSFIDMENTLDKAAMWDSGTYALRPTSTVASPGVKGRIYYVESGENAGDTFVDMGTGWRYTGIKLGALFAYPDAVTANMEADGLLAADGRLLTKTGLYAPLFALIGHDYNGGADPGSNQFRIPDLRGRVPVSPDNVSGLGTANRLAGPDTLGGGGGEEKHTTTVGEMPAHDHGGVTGDTNPLPGNAVYFTSGANSNLGTQFALNNQSSNHHHSIPSQGGGQAHNNMQPYQIATWVIRAA